MDSTGRARLFARTLEIPSTAGPRKDVAHFAHFEGFEENEPRGQVVIGWLERGWNWRIPLQNRLSVGVVMNKDEAAKLGTTPEERLENAIARDPVLSAAGGNRRRVSEVATYTNYQLISSRGHGPGWVMTGDAFGFVDPMLSPGLWLALHSAETLSENLDDLPAFARHMKRQLKAWMEMIGHYYSGRIFSMYHQGVSYGEKVPVRLVPRGTVAFRHDGRVHGLWRDHAIALWPGDAQADVQPRRLGKRRPRSRHPVNRRRAQYGSHRPLVLGPVGAWLRARQVA